MPARQLNPQQLNAMWSDAQGKPTRAEEHGVLLHAYTQALRFLLSRRLPTRGFPGPQGKGKEMTAIYHSDMVSMCVVLRPWRVDPQCGQVVAL